MLFTEPAFLFVFLPVLLGLYLLPLPFNRNWLLLAASVLFYETGAGAFTGVILGSIVVNYAAALWIDRLRGAPAAARVLRAVVAANLVVLGVCKYAGFVASNVNAALGWAGMHVPVPAIALPIGISFFTFHAISYVVDVYRRDAVAQKGPVEAALYLLLFPQLIAGPIIRYRDIASQLTTRAITSGDLASGVRRFVIGLAKKMLVANIVAGPADRIFAMAPGELTAAHAWIGVACYTLQIYFDFSGYSDMAIGLGRMFGFRFPENFRYPYVATSVQEFWRRWHLSLSAWFRDYLYVPLGGNRVSERGVYLNLIVVFFLCGLWHGASWTFVVWGLYHGTFLVAERVARSSHHWPEPGRGRAMLSHAYTLLVVMVGWVFFRADSLSAAIGMLRAMAGFGDGLPTTYAWSWYTTPEVLLAVVAGVMGSMPVWPALGSRLRSLDGPYGGAPVVLGWWPSAATTAALTLLLAASVMLSAAKTYSPFIYFRF